jgi:hypothetical protein
MGVEDFAKSMTRQGWYSFPEIVPTDLIERMRIGIEKSYVNCRELQTRANLPHTEGTVHHLIGQDDSFLDYLAWFESLNDYTEDYFQGKYILNAFGGNLLRKGMSYAANIHRDIRSFSGALPLMLNTIVMLDDFTMANGATYLMHRGHEWIDAPSEIEFSKSAFQITGKAGTVVFFNSNMWHKAGENTTDKARRSLTPMFSRPFYKPQFDYPRAVGYGLGDSYSPYLKQVLGYDSRIPQSLTEWYVPKEKRMYKGNQG